MIVRRRHPQQENIFKKPIRTVLFTSLAIILEIPCQAKELANLPLPSDKRDCSSFNGKWSGEFRILFSTHKDEIGKISQDWTLLHFEEECKKLDFGGFPHEIGGSYTNSFIADGAQHLQIMHFDWDFFHPNRIIFRDFVNYRPVNFTERRPRWSSSESYGSYSTEDGRLVVRKTEWERDDHDVLGLSEKRRKVTCIYSKTGIDEPEV